MSPPVIPLAKPKVAPIVQIGIGDRYDAASVAALWGTARWSTAGEANEWGGQEPLWQDVTCEVLECSTFTGREGSIDQFEVGTATIVVRNADGWADYQQPVTGDALLTMRPGRQIRVGVSVNDAAAVWLWRGSIDVTEPGYVPDEGDTVTIGCVDAKGDAGRAELPRLLEKVGAGEAGYQRFNRLLDQIAWPAWRRKHDVDAVKLGGTDFGNRIADELDRTSESSSGHVYGDVDGKVTFRRRDWMVWAGTDPVDATIGNVGAGDVCPSGWEIRFGRDDITTMVLVARDGETPLVMTNREALGLYGTETYERSDLLPIDNMEMSRIASRILTVRSPDHMPRVAAVTLDAATGDGDVAALLTVASPYAPTRVRARHRGRDGRIVFDRTLMVTGITHTISPVDGWTARVALDDAMPHRQVDNPARWSDPNTRWTTDDQWAMSL